MAEKIEISQTEAELEEGKTLQLTATVLPENTTDNSVKWESEDETIATVDENGLVTAVSHGETVIKVTAQDGSSVIATCVLKVLLPDGIAQISATDRQMQIYSLDGRRLNAFQKGVNIVRMADGTVRRIAVK